MNCERKDTLKFLWEWDLIYHTCIHPTFSNHCNWWLCNQSRDFFCDTTYVVSFYHPLYLPVQSQFWKTGNKMKSTGKASNIAWSFRRLYTEEAYVAVQCDTALLSLIKGNLCGLLKQRDSTPLNKFISIQGFCSLAFILCF